MEMQGVIDVRNKQNNFMHGIDSSYDSISYNSWKYETRLENDKAVVAISWTVADHTSHSVSHCSSLSLLKSAGSQVY